MEKKDIVSYNYDELQDEIKSIGEKPFRAKQIYAWLHEKLAEEFDEMTNLSKALREKLDQAYEIRKVKVVAHQISKVDPTGRMSGNMTLKKAYNGEAPRSRAAS